MPFAAATTGDAIAAFERDGVALVRRAFTDRWLGMLDEAVDAALATPSPLSREYAPTGRGHFFADHHMSQNSEDFQQFIEESPAAAIPPGYCNLMSGNLSEVCALRRFTGGLAPPVKRGAIVLSHGVVKPSWRKRMDLRHTTTIEAVLEHLIANGATDLGRVFGQLFELAMHIEREQYLKAGHRTPERQGYANGYKRIDTPTVAVQVPKTAGHGDDPPVA